MLRGASAVEARRAPCPVCHAPAGWPCRYQGGDVPGSPMLGVHLARERAAILRRRLLAGTLQARPTTGL